jgi:hypothetical protein
MILENTFPREGWEGSRAQPLLTRCSRDRACEAPNSPALTARVCGMLSGHAQK